MIDTHRVEAIGSQMELTLSTTAPVYTKYLYKKPDTTLTFTAAQDTIARRTEISTDGNNHGQSFLFGVAQPDGATPGHTAWFEDPKNAPCTIPFVQSTKPAHYYVREVKFV